MDFRQTFAFGKNRPSREDAWIQLKTSTYPVEHDFKINFVFGCLPLVMGSPRVYDKDAFNNIFSLEISAKLHFNT